MSLGTWFFRIAHISCPFQDSKISTSKYIAERNRAVESRILRQARRQYVERSGRHRAPVDWIADQLGHTHGKMISQQYGTWIKDDGPDVVDMLQIDMKLSLVTVASSS